MSKIKRLSILGDSISTYSGISNDAAANSTLAFNRCFYNEPFPKEKTYWWRIIDELGLTLCVNNSYSGGNLSGEQDPTSGISRAHNLSRNDGTSPDIIIVFIGTNDVGRGIDLAVFSEDYRKTLLTIKKKYENAIVCCVNLADRSAILRDRVKKFNEAIEEAVECAGEGFFVADLFSSRLNGDIYYMNTVDGLHPDEDGMRIIAQVVKDTIVNYLNKN